MYSQGLRLFYNRGLHLLVSNPAMPKMMMASQSFRTFSVLNQEQVRNWRIIDWRETSLHTIRRRRAGEQESQELHQTLKLLLKSNQLLHKLDSQFNKWLLLRSDQLLSKLDSQFSKRIYILTKLCTKLSLLGMWRRFNQLPIIR